MNWKHPFGRGQSEWRGIADAPETPGHEPRAAALGAAADLASGSQAVTDAPEAPADAPTLDPDVVEIPAASVQPCPSCGSLVLWWDALGGAHCMACERKGFERGLRLVQKARRRQQQAVEPAKHWPPPEHGLPSAEELEQASRVVAPAGCRLVPVEMNPKPEEPKP